MEEHSRDLPKREIEEPKGQLERVQATESSALSAGRGGRRWSAETTASVVSALATVARFIDELLRGR